MRGLHLRHLITAIVIGGIYLAGGFQLLDQRITDLRFRILSRPAASAVTVVAIDGRSLGELDVWPWPRGYHATVLDNLLASGARRVAFDLDFSSRSEPEEDLALADALERAGERAILPVFRQTEPGGAGAAGDRRVVASRPLEIFSRNAILASINIRPEAGGLVRRYWPFDTGPLRGAPSLASALAGVDADREPFPIDYSVRPASIRTISYLDALTGQFDPADVRGRAVVVGATAVELGDRVAVPVYRSLPGPVLQAMAYESLATGRILNRPAPHWIFLLTVAVVLAAARSLGRLGWRRGGLLLMACCTAVALASLGMQWGAGLLVDVTPLAAGLAAAWALELIRGLEIQKGRLALQSGRRRTVASRMRHVVENSLDAIITVNERGRVETYNSAAARIFGRRDREAVGRSAEELVEGGLPEDSGGRLLEGTGIRRDGSTFVVEMSVTAFELGDRRLRVAFLRDITERKRQERDLHHQATHDALTDLPNRFLLRGRMEELLARARDAGETAAFLILDLDRFKEVNDTLGHQVGDLLLQRIAGRLQGPLREEDTIARLGGDEFAVLLPGADRERARFTSELLIEALRAPFGVEGLSLQVDTSIGVAIFPDHGSEASTLIQRADVAMYEAKRVRNAVAFYDPERDFNSLRHLTLKGDLRKAVEEDRFQAWFQPKISGHDGRIAGVEALIRWNHPEHGMLPPGEFIPLAEHTGLIKPITLWILKSALMHCARWRELGLDLTMSVNCSAKNLLDEELPSAVAALLQTYEVDPRRLVLEITETAIIEDPRRALEVLTLLADLGVRISIDDFGTGYSSLEYLKKLPASELKIDRSFVMSMVASEGDAVIVRSTIDLAHNLGLEAAAEGVDSPEVWTRLRALGCDLGQGYYFSRPLPEERFLEWLRDSDWGFSRDDREKSLAVPALAGAAEPSLT